MQASDIPTKSPKVFAQSASGTYVRTVPQTTVDTFAASFDLGFPPATFTDEGAGGKPPDGRDANGMWRYTTAWARWFQAGGSVPYDSAFQAAIGGYPSGARVASVATPGLVFRSTADNNVTNPDTGGAGWAIAVDGVTAFVNSVNGYRTYASGYKECWGRALVPANGTLQIDMPVTHTGFIIPNIAAQIVDVSGSVQRVGIKPVSLNNFILQNWESVDLVVNWSTRGS